MTETTEQPVTSKADLINTFRGRAFVGRDLTAIDEYLTDDFVDHFAPPTDPPGRDGVRVRLGQASEGFHTEGVDVLLQFERGDFLIQVISIRMRHTGEFMGLPPTGREIRVGGFDAFRIRHGRLAEHWGVYDIAKIPDALGMSPASWGQMWHE
jgi:predicted SnoaL-like aldol condensation-catalyzing enzyme